MDSVSNTSYLLLRPTNPPQKYVLQPTLLALLRPIQSLFPISALQLLIELVGMRPSAQRAASSPVLFMCRATT